MTRSQEMAADLKQVPHGRVYRQEALRGHCQVEVNRTGFGAEVLMTEVSALATRHLSPDAEGLCA